ncbi:MAG: NAD(P)-dependent oxidoreductase [Gammaproteobacteria bacterium]
MMRVLVTGSGGMLGGVLMRTLRRRGMQAAGYDLRNGRDILNARSLAQALRGMDLCVHAAAVADLYAAAGDPAACRRINVQGTRVTAEQCAKQNVKLLFTSTACAYGNNGRSRQFEDSPLRPGGTYSETKVQAEKSLAAIAGLDYRIIRPATFYGPGMRAALATQTFIDDCRAGRAMQIHGDGKQTRNFTHVADIAAAFASVAEQWPREKIFNAASDEETSVLELAILIARLTNTAPRIEHTPQRFEQIHGSSLDCTRLKNYGWRPAYALESGLRLSLDCPPQRAAAA